MFQAFQTKAFQAFLQEDQSTEIDNGIYKNIYKFGMHQVVSRTLVLPYSDVIEWFTWKIDHESRTILNLEDKHVSIYQYLILNQLYHFKEAHVKVTPEWLKSKTKSINFL